MTEIPHIDEWKPWKIPDGHWIDINGDQVWIKDGQRHRIDGPAIIEPDGSKYWIYQGRMHRTDGPAVVYQDGGMEWRLNGVEFPIFEDWLEYNIYITDTQKVLLKLKYG